MDKLNLDDLMRARAEGMAGGVGSGRWIKAAVQLMDAFPALYATAKGMNANAQAMREEAALLRLQVAELQGQRGVLLGWIKAVLPALEVVDALEDFEDGGEALKALFSAGQKLVSTPVRCAGCDLVNGCPEFCGCQRAEAVQPADSVKIPTSEAEAELMQKLGHEWLKQHAPHRLVPQQAAPEPQGNLLDRFVSLADQAGIKSIHDLPGLIPALQATEQAPEPVATLIAAVNKAMQEALAGAEQCRGKPSFAGVRPEWDDGYINGVKCMGMIVQASMCRRVATQAREGERA